MKKLKLTETWVSNLHKTNEGKPTEFAKYLFGEGKIKNIDFSKYEDEIQLPDKIAGNMDGKELIELIYPNRNVLFWNLIQLQNTRVDFETNKDVFF